MLTNTNITYGKIKVYVYTEGKCVKLTVGYWRLQTSARCIPVTTPRRAANLCSSSPIMVANRSTHRS